jgi:hypothetical protein
LGSAASGSGKFNTTVDDLLLYPEGATVGASGRMPAVFLDAINRQKPIDEDKLN